MSFFFLHNYDDDQTFHWTWMCENEEHKTVLAIRAVSGAITMITWSTWAIPSVEVAVSNALQIGIVQVVKTNFIHNKGVL